MMENTNTVDDEINLIELFQILWNEKLKLSLITFIAIILSIFYALSLPDIYKSEMIVAPASSSGSNLSSMASQYAGMASLAGISLPTSGETDQVAMGIKVMLSLSFFEKFITNNDLYFDLLAPKGWDPSSDKLIIDSDIYNEKTNTWVSSAKFSVNGKPSMQTAHRFFLKNFSIENDKKTGIITLSYKHFSPFIAKKILRSLVLEMNEMTKNKDITVAQDSINFLEVELTNTNLNSLRGAMNGLILKQIETITLANASPEYFLKTLSSSTVPELKSEPNRAILVILSTIVGFIMGVTLVILRHYAFGPSKK